MEMWQEKENQLVKHFKFQDFKQAFQFMKEVAIVAEQQQHHPWWSNVYNKVTIKLTTHDEGNKITEKDHQLAKAIDKIVVTQ